MNQINDPTKSKQGCKSGWTDNDKRKIASIVWPLADMQKAYGRDFDAKLVMQGWEAILSKKYSADQICYALEKYALEGGDDFPSPKNLNDILNPPEPRITEAEYVAAQKYQERNNWPMMSDAQDTIDKYRKQNNEKQKQHKIECKKIQNLITQSAKMINNVN